MVIEGGLTWGRKHTIQDTDFVLQNCVPETYIISLTNAIPINSIKNRQYNNFYFYQCLFLEEHF